jgi:hypothetical protein
VRKTLLLMWFSGFLVGFGLCVVLESFFGAWK